MVLTAGLLFAHKPPPARLELVSEVPACPDAAKLSDEVRSRLGYDPFQPDAGRRVDVRFDRADAGLRATVALYGADGGLSGSRRLTSPGTDCAELGASSALAIAIAVDPLMLTRPGPSARALNPIVDGGPNDAGSPPMAGAAVDAGTAVAASAGAISVIAGLFADTGRTPGPAVGATAGGRWSLDAVSIEGELAATLPAGETREETSIGATMILASVRPCRLFGPLAACAVASAGVLSSAGEGLIEARSPLTPVVSVGARLSYRVPVHGRWSARLFADAFGNLARTRLLVGGSEVWRSAVLGGQLGLGVDWEVSR